MVSPACTDLGPPQTPFLGRAAGRPQDVPRHGEFLLRYSRRLPQEGRAPLCKRPLPPRYLAFPEGLCRFLVCVRLFVSRLISPGDRGSQLSHSDLRVSPQLCHRSAVGCWASAFTSWNFGFLFCRNGDNKTSSTEWS